ncbi:putative pyruvate, phosphate dikinase regulatory protein [mine drainage metagenome]|uniref:Putative pyruvate, phosphate dikinase regulatory protein n=1 Tax=mine drainage metagenome TaxID=410659 RepID=A0A1J5RX60_9ZZZZ
MVKKFHLHLVSDATGETVSAAARACLVQFDKVEAITHLWCLVRTEGQVERVISGIEANPGLVLATVLDGGVRGLLEEACRQMHVPYVPVLDPVMAALSGYLDSEFGTEPGRQHVLDAEYFKRIDAMHFTLAHDDGQMLQDLDKAEIILVGISRTSKTPTCMYLANRGLKAANIPLVPGIEPPPELFAARRPLIVGLTKEPKSLSDIRKSRLQLLNDDPESDYADLDRVREEVAMARRLFARHGWPVIDVSRRSIEEASAAILQLYARRNGQNPGQIV